jgi:hypothetical protein
MRIPVDFPENLKSAGNGSLVQKSQENPYKSAGK